MLYQAELPRHVWIYPSELIKSLTDFGLLKKTISGIRGIFGEDLNLKDVMEFTNNFSSLIKSQKCVIGRDTRPSGKIIQEIVNKFDLRIEIGGGIRTIDSIKKYTDAGVEKVILGSAAIKDKNFLKEACEEFTNKIALGLDAKDGYLSISGWKENSNL